MRLRLLGCSSCRHSFPRVRCSFRLLNLLRCLDYERRVTSCHLPRGLLRPTMGICPVPILRYSVTVFPASSVP
ncbi:hypothetical protein ACFPRL_22880 [Pseudoclavibacter helvolus]